jgi:hypothetical protein
LSNDEIERRIKIIKDFPKNNWGWKGKLAKSLNTSGSDLRAFMKRHLESMLI